MLGGDFELSSGAIPVYFLQGRPNSKKSFPTILVTFCYRIKITLAARFPFRTNKIRQSQTSSQGWILNSGSLFQFRLTTYTTNSCWLGIKSLELNVTSTLIAYTVTTHGNAV